LFILFCIYTFILCIHILGVLYVKVYPCIPVGSDWSVRPCYFFLITFLILFFLYNIAFSLFITRFHSGRVRSLSLEPHGFPPSHVVAAHSQNQINPPNIHICSCTEPSLRSAFGNSPLHLYFSFSFFYVSHEGFI